MFGWRYVKFEPNCYIFKYRKGRVVRSGAGLAFWYYQPSTSIIKIPIESRNVPFIFQETTADYQAVTIQGEIVYRISDPEKIRDQVNYSIDTRSLEYLAEDPQKLEQRIVNIIRMSVMKQLSVLQLKPAIRAAESIATECMTQLKNNNTLAGMGLEVTALNILAIQPGAETARALEAETRENILKDADDAIYRRRNFAVEQERIIKENELNTEIAVEQKNRQIRETQMEAERSVKEKERLMQQEDMAFRINQEEENIRLTDLAVKNRKTEAEARAYSLKVQLDNIVNVNPEIIRALAAMNMDPARMIANAFDGLASQAGKIGELNISPELLHGLMERKK